MTISLETGYYFLMAFCCSKWTLPISWLRSGRQRGKFGTKGSRPGGRFNRSRRGHGSRSGAKHDWTGARNLVSVPHAGTGNWLPPMDLCSGFMCISPSYSTTTASASIKIPSGSKLVWQDPACHAVRLEPKVFLFYNRKGEMAR